jgi:hypothetical protein
LDYVSHLPSPGTVYKFANGFNRVVFARNIGKTLPFTDSWVPYCLFHQTSMAELLKTS